MAEAQTDRIINSPDAQRAMVADVVRRLEDELKPISPDGHHFAELYHSERTARAQAEAALTTLTQTQARCLAAQEAAEAAGRTKDEFLAILSHELRTPLQPVLSAASALLRDRRLPGDLLDDVRTIQRNVQLEASLIDDLLDLTRFSAAKLALTRKPVNLDSVIARSIDICEPDLMAKRLTLSMETHGTPRKWVSADPGRLQQILWNLIKNAVKFTPAVGQITVRTFNTPDQRVVIEVVDTGMGIEPQVLPRIFEPFEQGGSTVTQRFGGLGLGLAISRLLAERHDGTLSAASAGKGCGATFRLTLPTVAGPIDSGASSSGASSAPDAARAPAAPPAPVRSSLAGLRVLLVDDHHDTAELIQRLLRQFECQVSIAYDFASASQLGACEAFDLLISDLSLPDGSGHALMESLKARGLKGIALTGHGAESDIQRSHAVGFGAHLTKPITLDQLVTAIEQVISGAKP